MFGIRITRRTTTSQQGTWEVVEKNASKKRFGEYLRATGYNGDRALILYEWNTQISAAFWGQLGHIEVGLRNAISARMSLYCERAYNETDWIFIAKGKRMLATSELNRLFEAERRVESNRKDISFDQIISELPLGFWATLLGRRYRFLWPELAGGFLGLTSRNPNQLVSLVQRARWLRNRIGHHHRIWNLDLESYHREILNVARIIDPDFEGWLASTSSVPELLGRRPECVAPKNG